MNASQKKSDESWAIIRTAFARAIPDGSAYTVCYARWIKSGLLIKTLYNYVIGFRDDTGEIVIVPIHPDGSITGEPVRLQKSDISKVSKTLQGNLKFTTSQSSKPVVFSVPYFLPDFIEDHGQLPINQHAEAERFYAMIKRLY